MQRRRMIFPILLCVFVANRPVDATASLDYRIPSVSGPSDPIEVFLDVTSDNSDVAAVGCRLVYNPAEVSLVSVVKGADAPSSWNFVFQDMTSPGEVDLVLTDPTAAAATLTSPSGEEMVKLTFSRVGSTCAPVSFSFNSGPPAPGPPTAAFPQNNYVIFVDTNINIEAASTASASGPALTDHAFVRGNIANRGAHSLDLQDVVDLAATLFGGFDPGFNCDAAFDVNDDGGQNIADVVALVQGVFGATGFVIPAPLSSPGVVVPDGGSIPSVLGCAEGEVCP